MNVVEAIYSRRSIRAYMADPVPDEIIEDLLWAAVQAPSAPISGETPWALCVIEGIKRLVDYGSRANDYHLKHQSDSNSQAWKRTPGFKFFWDAPTLVGGIVVRNIRRNQNAGCAKAWRAYFPQKETVGLNVERTGILVRLETGELADSRRPATVN